MVEGSACCCLLWGSEGDAVMVVVLVRANRTGAGMGEVGGTVSQEMTVSPWSSTSLCTSSLLSEEDESKMFRLRLRLMVGVVVAVVGCGAAIKS